MTAAPGPAELLRLELRELLGDLDAEIKTRYPATACDLARRVAVAEVSAVRDLTHLARQALVGGALEGDPRCTTSGQALDLRDSLAIAARDVRLEQERIEAELATLQLLPWPPEFLAALQAHLEQEAGACADQEQAAQRGRQRAAALRAIVTDIADATLDALGQAARLPAAERAALGAAAQLQVERAVGAWLAWLARLDVVELALQERCEPVRIARALTEAAAQDAKTANFLAVVRQAMKLRRQHLRLQGSQQRLAAVLAAGDALASLQARICMS